MPKKYKWEIKELSAGKSLKVSAKIALRQRMQSLASAIKKFGDEDTVENLHEIRIALRRLRYNMEIFISCFNKGRFIAFYQLVEHLQDLTGTKRDIDVLAENIKNICNDKNNPEVNSFLQNVEAKDNQLRESLTLELMKFTHSKELKDFSKML